MKFRIGKFSTEICITGKWHPLIVGVGRRFFMPWLPLPMVHSMHCVHSARCAYNDSNDNDDKPFKSLSTRIAGFSVLLGLAPWYPFVVCGKNKVLAAHRVGLPFVMITG